MRTLSGEWVVNKSVWKRLRTEAREREMERKQRKRERSAGSGRSVPLDPAVPESASTEMIKETEMEEGADKIKATRRKREEKVIYYIHGGQSAIDYRVQPVLVSYSDLMAHPRSGPLLGTYRSILCRTSDDPSDHHDRPLEALQLSSLW